MTLPSKLLPYLCVQVYMSSCLLRTWKSEKNGEQKSDRQLQLSIHKNCATASSSISPRYPQYCESLFISCSHHSTNALRAPYQKPESLKVTCFKAAQLEIELPICGFQNPFEFHSKQANPPFECTPSLLSVCKPFEL